MGKTRRYIPKNGDFKKLKASKQKRAKKQRAEKVHLSKFVGLQNRRPNMTQLNASLYMEEDVHCCDHTKEYCDSHKDGVGCNLVAGI